ncbi:hypothetical protein E2C01_052894 [Portunus trituberculatus]|uniref:Uncharacterized protein n=1 Tax=Portunus trituberculatus TaxID=210409 RepID=A0A5B7GQK5_PORTR|nr:hypothetical protein [Portunus trituberculatus]
MPLTLVSTSLKGKTRSLGNGLALVTVWEHNISKVALLQESHFCLGNWEVCHGEVVLPKGRCYISTRIAILQLVYWAQLYLLPMLCCPGCQKIGYSINTCRSATRCSCCSGPHPYSQQDVTCTRQHHSFQCGGPPQTSVGLLPIQSKSPAALHLPHTESHSLHINMKLRGLQWNKPQASCRPPPPSTLVHMALPSAATLVHPEVFYLAVTGGNHFSVLTDLHKEEEIDPLQEIFITSAPIMT